MQASDRRIPQLPITAEIGGRIITRGEILRLEDHRIDAAAKKLGVEPPQDGTVHQRRETLLRQKMVLGTSEMFSRLASDIKKVGFGGRLQARLSGRRRACVVDIRAPSCEAEKFVDYYWQSIQTNQEEGLLRLHPDHFVQRVDDQGQQEVIETIGGSPFAGHFLIDYEDVQSVVTRSDPSFDGQIVGVVRSNGAPVGGVRHQFRNTTDGLHARLTAEFPLPSASYMLKRHGLHLAIEFSNWIEEAAYA